MNPIIVRFNQLGPSYDINLDADTVTFMATTDRGSYWTTFVADGARSVREIKARFKERCIEAIQRGETPREIEA